MESASSAAWAGSYELQLAKNWTTTEVAPADDAHQVWASAVGHPLHYGSVADIFGSACSLQPYVVPSSSSYSSGGGQQQQLQMLEYNNNYYAAAAAAHVQHHDGDPIEKYIDRPEQLFQERKEELQADADLMKWKMHRYPPSIQALGDWYTVPKVVAIGPYYHGRDHLQNAEKMKHVAAAYCIQQCNKKNSGLSSVQDMYDAVVSVAKNIKARNLYDKDVMAGISYDDDFLPMMFYDACFLVMYILRKSGEELDLDVSDFFGSNDKDIAVDIMLLENQIPLELVGAVMEMCTADLVERMRMLIVMWWEDGFLQDRIAPPSALTSVEWDQDYYDNAPHLLGFLRSYIVGKRSPSSSELKVSESDLDEIESIPISAGAIERACRNGHLPRSQRSNGAPKHVPRQEMDHLRRALHGASDSQ